VCGGSDFAFEGENDFPVKHTSFDTFEYAKTFADPDFE
jgi:hypothetical protein